jgi:hypothetical protein
LWNLSADADYLPLLGEILSGDTEGNVMIWRSVKVARVLKAGGETITRQKCAKLFNIFRNFSSKFTVLLYGLSFEMVFWQFLVYRMTN